MVGGPRPGGGSPDGILDLLALASARPGDALAKAHAILAADPAPYEASVAHQAIGMLHREFGDLAAATAELNAAVRLARAARSPERESDVLATLGVTLAALATGEPGLAAARAQAALRLFTGQHRPWWRTHAGLLLLQARCASRPSSARLLRQAAQVAADLDLLGSNEAVQARLLAGRL